MFSNSLKNTILNFVLDKKQGFHNEVEIRFESLTDDNKLRTYSKEPFTRLLNEMKRQNKDYIVKETIDRTYNERQHHFFTKPHYNNTIISTIDDKIDARTKIKVHDIKVEPDYKYGYKVGFAYEKSLSINDYIVVEKLKDENQTQRRFKPFIRTKYRHSFIINGNQLDLTRVLDDNGEHYEIEFELLDSSNLDQFFITSQQIYMILNDTISLYSLDEKRDCFRDINIILKYGLDGLTRKNAILRDYKSNKIFGSLVMDNLTQARNLKTDDMNYGGLIPSPFITKPFKQQKQYQGDVYTVTHKADGFRKLLFINKTGLWLLMAKDANLVVRMNFDNNYMYTIFDGELIPKESRREGAPEVMLWYLIFDCMFSPLMGKDIQFKRHSERMAHSSAISLKLTNNIIAVETKTFITVTRDSDPYSFFTTMRQMFREQDFERFENDGFMFTPENAPYLIKTKDIIMNKMRNKSSSTSCDDVYDFISKERTLIKYPDICKWKPPELMTVDLSIRWVATKDGRRLELYSNNNDPSTRYQNPYVMFKGTSSNIFTNSMIEITDDMYNLPTWTVVEFAWDKTKQKLVKHRVRLDKNYPNSCEVAMDVWDIIRTFSIKKETLMGMTFDIVRKYHNKVKNTLFYENKKPEGILLDIGSGRGGDVLKWRRNFKEIIAVEPNEQHIEELFKRVEQANMEENILIVNTGGEDYKTITEAMDGRKADVISMMLSMSFFWNPETPENLTNLAKTIINNIAPNGKLIFLTQDGRALSELFVPSFNGLILDNPLILGPATIHLNGPKVFINIEDTIVKDQEEYLVYIYHLVTQINILLKTGTAKLEQFKTCFGDEYFMTEAEHIFTQFFAYGVISFDIQDNEYKNFIIKNFELNKMNKGQVKGKDVQEPLYDDKGVMKPVKVGDQLDEEGRLVGDDDIIPIKVKDFNENVYKIGTIGEGSCFFHALLKACYPVYQENSQYKQRSYIVKRFRSELAILLLSKFKNEKQANYYIVNNGLFPKIDDVQKFTLAKIKTLEDSLNGKDEDERDEIEAELDALSADVITDLTGTPIDYSPKGLFEYIQSNRDVGDDIISYVSSPIILNVAVIVIKCIFGECVYIYDTIDKNTERPIIVIAGDGTHYETVGIERLLEDGTYVLSTMFFPDDPFVEHLLKMGRKL